MNTSDRPILLRTEMGAGHGGPSGRYDAWRDEARTLAFILAATLIGPNLSAKRLTPRDRFRTAPRRARTMRTALRARWPGPIGLADQAPKHAHGGRRPWASELTINAVNADEHDQRGDGGPRRHRLSDQQGTDGELDPRHDRDRPRRRAETAGLRRPRRTGRDLRSAGDHERDAHEDRGDEETCPSAISVPAATAIAWPESLRGGGRAPRGRR